MKRFKKLLSIVLALCLMLTMLPTLAYAAYGTYTDEYGVTYDYSQDYSWVYESYVTYISPKSCAEGLENIKSITVPVYINGQPVTDFSGAGFSLCESLETVSLPPYIHSYYSTINNCSFGVAGLARCPKLTSITVNGSTSNWRSIGGVLFSGDAKDLVCYPPGKTNTTYTIPSSTVTVGEASFANCVYLREVVFPEGLTDIGWAAFYGCIGLESVTIPSTVKKIDDSVFSSNSEWCPNLKSVTYNGSKSDWDKISIGTNNDALTTANITFLKEDAPEPEPDPNPQPGEITFRNSPYQLNIGEELVIEVSIPNGENLSNVDVSWSSGDDNIIEITPYGSVGTIGSDTAYAFATLKTGKTDGTVSIVIELSDGRSASCEATWEAKLNSDYDGDGLYDYWEVHGVDTNGDGVVDLPLYKMGADPYIPDIFVEVDWMIQPEKQSNDIVTQPEISLAPSETAMQIVYNSFKNHISKKYPNGINLHIDAGSDSIDFVTGKKWGKLSGGTAISADDYKEVLDLGENFTNWEQYLEKYFTPNRRFIFKHCFFSNCFYYQNSTSYSGISNNIPGQYFIVSSQEWVRNTGDVGVAGTFMHELGHTLGLTHGGYDHSGNMNHIRYKPNYLSIMNYLFQTRGLTGTNAVTYSNYELPDLNESALSESLGVDPNAVTYGTGLGTSLWHDGRTTTISGTISRTPIDFNFSGTIDDGIVSTILTPDTDGKGTLTGTRDWEHIVFTGGNVGNFATGEDIMLGISTELSFGELSLEESLEMGVLAYTGSGALEAIGPFTLPAGDYEQSVYVRVKNLANQPVRFSLHVDEGDISSRYDTEVEVDPSITSISYVDIPIRIKAAQAIGNYALHATLSYDNAEIASVEIPVMFDLISAENIEKLISENPDELPDIVVDQYSEILDTMLNKYYTISFDANGGSVNVSSKTVIGGATYGHLPIPLRSGFVFTGWYTDAVEGILVSESMIVELSGSQTLYAHWNKVIKSGTCGDNLTWAYDELSALTISGTGAMYDYDNIIEISPWYRLTIKEINILSGVTSIGWGAFQDAGITTISIPDTVEEIGAFAFYRCGQLRWLDVPDSVKSIDSYAFAYCQDLVTFNIPNSVTSIASSAFADCYALRTIDIPESVISIGSNAFSKCNYLDVAYYSGTEYQWNQIQILDGNDCLQKAEIRYMMRTIRYDPNAGIDNMWDGHAICGQPFTLPSCGHTPPEGKTFLAWNVAGTLYSPGDVYTFTEDTRLFAVWTSQQPIRYGVTFNANGGTVSTSNKSVTNGLVYGTLPTPTRDGYAFDGWYTAPTGGDKITGTVVVNLAADQTLYAHWTAIMSEISAKIIESDIGYTTIKISGLNDLLTVDTVIIAANYDISGRMVGIAKGNPTLEPSTVTFSQEISEDWILFFLDPISFAPLCQKVPIG